MASHEMKNMMSELNGALSMGPRATLRKTSDASTGSASSLKTSASTGSGLRRGPGPRNSILPSSSTPILPSADSKRNGAGPSTSATSSRSELPRLPRNSKWAVGRDPSTGRVFYANRITGASTYDKPYDLNAVLPSAPSGSPPKRQKRRKLSPSNSVVGAMDPNSDAPQIECIWFELYDEAKQHPYYYNSRTDSVQWEKPDAAIHQPQMNPNLLANAGDGKATIGRAGNSASEVSLASIHRTDSYDGPISAVRRDSNASTANSDWVPVLDKATGNYFWVNKRTKAVTWDKPAGLEGGSSPPSRNGSVSAGPGSGNAYRADSGGSYRELPHDLRDDIEKFRLEGYAKTHFSKHRKGLFRREVGVKKMLTFSKEPIYAPLLRSIPPKSTKEAIRQFKNVMMYMGDRVDKKDRDRVDLTLTILTTALQRPELRDELFLQLCKQTNRNPSSDSALCGWELMSLAAQTFPPSKDLENYLKNYIAAAGKFKDKVGVHAQYTLRKIQRICKRGSKGKPPSRAEIQRIRIAPTLPPVFDATIDEIMAWQRKEGAPRAMQQLGVPRVLVMMCEAVMRLQGCTTDGLFRECADADMVTSVRFLLDEGRFDEAEALLEDPHVPAAIMKLWLRELREPIIPDSLYDEAISSAEDPKKVLMLVKQLSENHKRVLVYLVRFLQAVADPANQQYTRMGVNNISMVFAPNIVRNPYDDPTKILANAKPEQLFVKNLLLHLKTR